MQGHQHPFQGVLRNISPTNAQHRATPSHEPESVTALLPSRTSPQRAKALRRFAILEKPDAPGLLWTLSASKLLFLRIASHDLIKEPDGGHLLVGAPWARLALLFGHTPPPSGLIPDSTPSGWGQQPQFPSLGLLAPGDCCLTRLQEIMLCDIFFHRGRGCAAVSCCSVLGLKGLERQQEKPEAANGWGWALQGGKGGLA